MSATITVAPAPARPLEKDGAEPGGAAGDDGDPPVEPEQLSQ